MGSGKHRHSKDKLYIIASEYARDWGGYKRKPEEITKSILPFDHCFLTLNKFVTPCCTEDGTVFDLESIKKHIAKGLNHPITNQILKLSDLIDLNISKDESGQFHCPLSRKIFNNHTKIVAVKTTGNVYSFDFLTKILKAEMKDPLAGVPISKEDLIVLQDPDNLERRYLENIPKIAKHVEKDTENEVAQPTEQPTGEMLERHKQLFQSKQDIQSGERSNLYTTHNLSASFTCTAMPAVYQTEFREKTIFEKKKQLYDLARINKLKGYVKIITTLGDLNIMLHCNRVPVITDNFLQHCEDGYYDNTIFHRCIANFMVQGGDPTGTGTGGVSSFYQRWIKGDKQGAKPDKYLKDEFDSILTHTGEGIVSMANSGPHTNGSQFFITFKSCQHLDMKHSVFGKVVGGLDVLSKFEKLETDKNDRPKDPPKIIKAVIYENPFKEQQLEPVQNEIAQDESPQNQDVQEGADNEVPARNRLKMARIAMLKRSTFKW